MSIATLHRKVKEPHVEDNMKTEREIIGDRTKPATSHMETWLVLFVYSIYPAPLIPVIRGMGSEADYTMAA